MTQRRRIAVTGIGLVSPLGIGTEATWTRLKAGESGIGPITRFDTTNFATTFAGELKEFEPTRWIQKKLLRQMDLFIQYGMAASHMALEEAGLLGDGLAGIDLDRVGVYVGAGLGGLGTIEESVGTLAAKGPRHGISPYFVPSVIANLAPGQISLHHGFRGPNFSHVSACSTGAHSIGEAMRILERGDVDVMVAGGCEATITPLAVGGFNSARALSTRNDAPTKASRPFDKDRDGFVMGEGAGILVLETFEHALARGAKILAEAIGYGANADAHHITSPAPGGVGAQRCMRLALKDAGLSPEDVGYVNAHGTSTVADAIETNAIREVFGKHAFSGLVVSSTKSMHGHLLGAAGGLEAGIACLSLRDQIIPPTINLEHPDPECDLDYCPNQARAASFDVAMSNSFGFGGTNATLLFRRAP